MARQSVMFDSPAARRLVPAGLALAFALAFCWPLLGHFGAIGTAFDWDQHQVYHWVPYETVRTYGQIPLWNPYMCGGIPMLANPQSRWLSPFFPVHLWLGPNTAIHIEIVAHIAIAWLGAFLLARTLGMSRLAALIPAVVFAGCSGLYHHIGAGHTGWLAYAYLPWIAAAATANRPVLAAVGLAIAVGEGGAYATSHAVLILGVMALYRTATERSLRPLAQLALTGAAAACFAAPKLLPMESLMRQWPRFTRAVESMPPELMARALLSRIEDIDPQAYGAPYGYYEYGAYVGPLALALAIVGAAAFPRRAALWIIVGIGAAALAVGHWLGGEWSPWAMLHGLPVFASQRAPSRFLLTTALAIAVLAGFGVEGLGRRLGRWRGAATLLLVGGLAGNAITVAAPLLRYVWADPAPAGEPAAIFVQTRNDSRQIMSALVQRNMGALNCYEPLEPTVWAVGNTEADYRGEYFLTNDGQATLIEWTPNRIVFEVRTETPNTLVVNQNYASGWRVRSAPGRTISYDGLVAVSVPATATTVELTYRSDRFAIGVLMAGAAAVASLVWRIRASRRRAPEQAS